MPSSPKVAPCPFCGSECDLADWGQATWTVHCTASMDADTPTCVYAAGEFPTEEAAIAAHNRVAGAVAEAARLREALEFYGDEENNLLIDNGCTAVKRDAGRRACAALGEGSP